MKTALKILTGTVITCLLIVSCTKSDFLNPSDLKIKVASEVDQSSLNSNAVKFYDNIKTVIFATGSNMPATRNGEAGENPLIDKLESIEIEVEETKDNVSFFDMPVQDQETFLTDWTILQAEDLSKKIEIEPELEKYIIEENEIIGGILAEEFGEETRSNVTEKVKDNKAFFAKIQKRMAQRAEEQALAMAENEEIATRGIISFNKEDAIPVENLITGLKSSARRGDFIVALPKHGKPWVFLNFSHDRFKVGHAGILTASSYSGIDKDSKMSLGCWTDGGVQDEYVSDWNVRCYIMGIQKIKWVWKWRGFKSGFYRTVTKMNPAPLASRVESYKGREYVKWYEFLTAKWAAPSRFTCTTLVWWCAKKEYDVNVSSWWATMVTPSGLYSDESTYVRYNVK